MRDDPVGGRTRESRLAVEVLESLRELNHRFLDLVGTPTGASSFAHGIGLSVETSGRVAQLSAGQKKAIADCPYALFNLRFDDAAHWRARLETAGQWKVCDQARSDAATVEFVRSALFFAWHVAVTARLAARFLLVMNEETAAAFRGLTIDCLLSLAATETDILTARWSECPAYWNALARAALRPNAAGLRRVQLSGLQLAAASQLN